MRSAVHKPNKFRVDIDDLNVKFEQCNFKKIVMPRAPDYGFVTYLLWNNYAFTFTFASRNFSRPAYDMHCLYQHFSLVI